MPPSHQIDGSRRATHVRSGFTLLEILVVVGVIALLIGLLLPVVSRARRAAGSVKCQSNLRQWAQAVTLYATDNHGFLPRRGQGVEPTVKVDRPADWFNALPPLLDQPTLKSLVAGGIASPGGVWACPQAAESRAPFHFDYAMNMWLSTWSASQPDRLDGVGDTGSMVFMADGPGPQCSIVPDAAAYSPVARHDGRINIAFLDGHVGAFDGAYVGCGVGDPHRPDVRWVVPTSEWGGPH